MYKSAAERQDEFSEKSKDKFKQRNAKEKELTKAAYIGELCEGVKITDKTHGGKREGAGRPAIGQKETVVVRIDASLLQAVNDLKNGVADKKNINYLDDNEQSNEYIKFITANIETITPIIASEFLSKNNHNRNLNKHKLKEYSDVMTAGEWQLNGESISIADNGDLMNGQTRLSACIASGCNFVTLVVRGIKRNNFSTIDTGKVRSGSDVLNIKGLHGRAAKNCNAASAICISFDNGYAPFANTEKINSLLTPEKRSEFVLNNKRLIEIDAMLAEFGRNTTGIPASEIIFLWFYMDKKHKNTGLFFDGMIRGINLSENDPRLAIRLKFDRDRNKKKKISRTERLGLVASCWRWFCSGRETRYHANYFKNIEKHLESLRTDYAKDKRDIIISNNTNI